MLLNFSMHFKKGCLNWWADPLRGELGRWPNSPLWNCYLCCHYCCISNWYLTVFTLLNPHGNMEIFHRHFSVIKDFLINQKPSESLRVEGNHAHKSPDNLIWTCNYSCSGFWSCCGRVLVIFCPTCGCYVCNRRQSPKGFLSESSAGGL